MMIRQVVQRHRTVEDGGRIALYMSCKQSVTVICVLTVFDIMWESIN